MPCDDCLNRREFLARAAAGAAALAALEACGDGQIGPPDRAIDGDVAGRVTYDLRLYPGLAAQGTLVDVSNNVAPDRAVIRTGATTFLALSKVCTHQGCSTDVRNNEFDCPCHGSRFASDGSVIRGPSVASPPIGPLARLPVTFDAATNTLTIG